jgi:pimeloyl-ACP methyl ester carboxylesterase
MESTDTISLATVPWRWFEFRDLPRPAAEARGQIPADFWQRVYQVAVDGQIVPFKYFRQAPAPGQRRPTLLLLHGLGLTIGSFRGIFPGLFRTHDLILPDYSGFTLDRSHRPGHVSFKSYTLALWRIADALGIAQLSLGGNSLGGGLALMAALLALPRVRCIVLSNPACFPQKLPRMYRMARVPLFGELLMAFTRPEKLLAGVEGIGYVDKARFDPVLRGHYTENFVSRRNRLCLAHIMRQLPANSRDMAAANYLTRLHEIRQPVLITWGLQDPLLVEGAGQRLADGLPNATFEPQADLAHMPHEEAPERVGRRWAEFLNMHEK